MLTYQLAPYWAPAKWYDRRTNDWSLPAASTAAWGLGPAHDLVKTGPDSYRITLEVPGASADDLTVQVSDGDLVVTCHRRADREDRRTLRREIRESAFEWRYGLPAFVEVTNAELRNGLLSVDLVRERSEALLPRRIEIASGKPRGLPAKAEGLFGRLKSKIDRALARR